MKAKMVKFFKRLLFIIIGGLFLWFSSLGKLMNLPIFTTFIMALWGIAFLVLLCALIKKKHLWILLFGIFMWQLNPTNSYAEVSGYFKTYCAKVEEAKKNDWKNDTPCDKEMLEEARYITSSQKGEEKKFDSNSPCTCSGEYDCAKRLMSLCSNYEHRHRLEKSENKKVHTVPEILAQKDSGCWPCDMAAIVFVVIQNLAFTLNSVMLDVSLMLLKLLFLGWIIFSGASAVIFPDKGMTFITQVLVKTIGIIFVGLVLSSNGMSTLYTSVLNPFMDMGLGLAEEVGKSATLSGKSFSDKLSDTIKNETIASVPDNDYCKIATETSQPTIKGGKKTIKFDFNKKDANYDDVFYEVSFPDASKGFSKIMSNFLGSSLAQKLISEDETESLLNDSMKNKLLCMTQKFYNQVRPFTATGQSLIEYANSNTDSFFGFIFSEYLEMWFIGWIIIGVFTIFSFLVAFRIMDIFIRLAFVLVLMPLFVAAIAFPATREFTKKGWDFLVHTIVEFTGLTLAVAFVMQMFESLLATSAPGELMDKIAAPYSEDYWKNLYAAVYGGGACQFFFALIAISYFGWKLLDTVTPVMEDLFGVKGIGGKSIMGGMLLSKAQQTKGLFDKAATAAADGKLRYQSDKSKKADEVKKGEKEVKELQGKADKAQLKADKEKDKSDKLQEKAKGADASASDKTKASMAKQKADDAQKEADKAKADLEKAKAQLEKNKAELSGMGFKGSNAAYKPRQYAENTVDRLHYGAQQTASFIEKYTVRPGQFLTKFGLLGKIPGVALVYGGKALSLGVRGTTKSLSMGVHAATATPDAIKKTATTIANAPQNFVNATKKAVDSAKETAKFSAYVAKRAATEAPKAVGRAAVSVATAPARMVTSAVDKTKKAASAAKETAKFSAYVAKRAATDAPKAVGRAAVSVATAPVRMVNTAVDKTKETAAAVKETAQFSAFLAKKAFRRKKK